jgi:hypothetical protein
MHAAAAEAIAEVEMACQLRYLRYCRKMGIASGGRRCACDDGSGKPCGDATSKERVEICSILDAGADDKVLEDAATMTSEERTALCYILEAGADDEELKEHRAHCELSRVKRAELEDKSQYRKAALMFSDRNDRYASRPDFDVAMRNAITVREEIERVNGRHYNNLQREAEYDRFFDCWYHHWPDDDNGKPMNFEFWFDNTIFTAPG